VGSPGDAGSGAGGTVTFSAEANTAGPFVIDGASLNSSGAPQLSNATFGVAVAPCEADEPCRVGTLVPNLGCVLAEAPAGHVDDGVMCNALKVSIFADEGSVSAGDQVSFAAFFENRAPTSVADVTLVATLPAGTYVPGSSSGTYDAGAHTLTWALGDLPANADGGVAFTLAAVEGFSSLAPAVTLTAPASLALRGDDVTLKDLSVRVGSGWLTASGEWNTRLDGTFQGQFAGDFQDAIRMGRAFGVPVTTRSV